MLTPTAQTSIDARTTQVATRTPDAPDPPTTQGGNRRHSIGLTMIALARSFSPAAEQLVFAVERAAGEQPRSRHRDGRFDRHLASN